MAIIYLLSWWYTRGWVWIFAAVFSNLREVRETFSVSILLKTWFSPWKQIYTPSTFRTFFQAAIDNLISRCVGATVRTGMLIAALFLVICTILLGLLTLIIWPVLPLLILILPVVSLAV